MNDPLILALDFGGSKLTAALTAAGSATWLDLQRHASPPGHDAAYEQAAIDDLARRVLAGQHPAAIGVSFGGPVLQTKGMVKLSHHVPGWEDTPLAALLEAKFQAPVAVANDANVGALGEWRFGAGKGCPSLLYVTVSTGVGGGWVLNRAIWDGVDGMAGEIGHIVVNPQGAPCVCGKHGCVEAEACGPAIARAARERAIAQPQAAAALLALSGGDSAAITALHVAQAAQAGDALSATALDHAARMLGAGIGTAINLMNPCRVVLGGGVTKSGEAWWRAVREAARYHVLPQMQVNIHPAALGDDAPLWGAVALGENLLSQWPQ